MCVDSSHEQYDNSIGSVLSRIISKSEEEGVFADYDLCYIEDDDGDLEYLLFVDGVGFPTCVSGPMDVCPTDKLWCVEAERKNWPNTVANRLLSGLVFGASTRNNHMHRECPRILDICLPGKDLQSVHGGLNFDQELDLQPDHLQGVFTNNICVGRNGGVRVVTADGFQPTCVGFKWDTDAMGAGNEQKFPCPSDRNFMCGSLQSVEGVKQFGWYAVQKGLVHHALIQHDRIHPECPYTACREC